MKRSLSKLAQMHFIYCQRFFSTAPSVHGIEIPAMREPILPNGSNLCRTNLYFTPIVEAQPAFDWNELMNSVQLRGLDKLFPFTFFDQLKDLHQKLDTLKSELESIEKQRLRCQLLYNEAVDRNDQELQNSCRMKSKELKSDRSKLKDCLRASKLDLFENVLKLPNKLRPFSNSSLEHRPDSSNQMSPIPPPNSIPSSAFSGSHLMKACGEYDVGYLAKFKQQEMCNLWHFILKFLNRSLSSFNCVRPCLLSDLARLPVVEACSWVNCDQVTHLQHTADDIFVPDDSPQPLINPFTRTCLIGSASLEAFTASIFDCILHKKTNLPIRLLSLGNIYGRRPDSAEHHDATLDGPSSCQFKQTKQISFFEINVDEATSMESFDNFSSTIADFWHQLQPCWLFRSVETPASELRKCEMARWSLVLVTQTKTPSSEETEIEMASLSLLGEWVSRRSGFKSDSGLYPSLIYGNLANLESILLGLENTGFYVPVEPLNS